MVPDFFLNLYFFICFGKLIIYVNIPVLVCLTTIGLVNSVGLLRNFLTNIILVDQWKNRTHSNAYYLPLHEGSSELIDEVRTLKWKILES